MESSDGNRGLLIEQHNDVITIDTTSEALQRVNDAIGGDTNHSELEYLQAVRDVIRYANAPGFNAETGTDEEPPNPDEADEPELAEEVKALESDLEHDQPGRPGDDHTDADE